MGTMQRMLVSITSVITLAVHAEASRIKGTGSLNSTAAPGVNPFETLQVDSRGAGPALSSRNGLFYEILGKTPDAVSWPQFPRTWFEEFTEHTTEVELSLFLPSFVTLVGVSNEVKFTHKTSLVLIASSRSHRQQSSANPLERMILDATEEDRFQLFHNPNGDMFRYVRSSPEYPVLGLCVVETGFRFSTIKTAGIKVVGTGTLGKDSLTEGSTQTVFSSFFSIPNDVPLWQIKKEACDTFFKSKVQPSLIKDHQATIREKLPIANSNPDQPCQFPTRSEMVKENQNDPSCQRWFDTELHAWQRSQRVARCALGAQGLNQCVTRQQRGAPCFMASKGQLIAGEAHTAGVCDHGLTCQLVEPPLMVLGGVWQKGVATCQPKTAPQ